jgi:SAM-dependent methyltransferase
MYGLIKKLDECYQDVYVGEELYQFGVRKCQPRWDAIKCLIPPRGVVLELGSAQGYFTREIALEYPDSLVVAFECDEASCNLQKAIFEAEGIYNVVLCQHRLTASNLAKWVDCVEGFDMVLALSVLHHFPPEDLCWLWRNLRGVAPDIIIEVTGEGEDEACGGEAKELARSLARFLDVVTTSDSHLGDYGRKIYASVGKSGSIVRSAVDAYMGVPHEGNTKFDLKWDGYWKLKGKRMVPGVNVWNLLQFNPVWPEREWWQAQAIAAYRGLSFKSDVRPWNLIVTSNGLRAIDYTTVFPKGDQAEFKGHEDYERLMGYFDEYIR